MGVFFGPPFFFGVHIINLLGAKLQNFGIDLRPKSMGLLGRYRYKISVPHMTC